MGRSDSSVAKELGPLDQPDSRTLASREVTAAEATANLQALAHIDYIALRDQWRRLYRVAPPPRVSRELLTLGVAWKLQERSHGGLGATTKRRLAELVKILHQDDDLVRSRKKELRPGATLIRDWHGTTHTVVVVEDGFEWRGERWRSLSAIARAITGVRWSGPRFFGLNGTGSADLPSREPSNG